MTEFKIGPDQTNDIRTARSYFLVPLLEPSSAHSRQPYLDRVIEAIQGTEYTDVYVLSHGWHRNFFSAVAAYDRLISRFTALLSRNRISPKMPPYKPLFLALHWNSDPEEDGWVDTAGRRDKASFLENAAALFEPSNGTSEGAFLNTLEDVYEFFTYISAPGVSALSADLDDKARVLCTTLIANGDIRGRFATGPPTSAEEKIALAWRCYEEATPQRVVVDQGEKAARFSNPWNALSNLLKFLIALLGASTVLGLLPRLLRFLWQNPAFRSTEERVVRGALSRPTVSIFRQWMHSLPPIEQDSVWLSLLVFLALAILLGTGAWQQTRRLGKGGRGLPVLAIGSWFPLQVLLTLPLLVYLFATFVFRTWLILLTPLVFWLFGSLAMWLFVGVCVVVAYAAGLLNVPVLGLFNERLRGVAGRMQDAPPRVRDILAIIARQPIRWLKRATAQDSQVMQLADTIDNQLAFWEMQRRAVLAGVAGGNFLQELYTQLAECGSPALKTARLHFIGHSFGGLVIANCARYLAQVGINIHTLCLLQAALASAWFEKEAWSRDPAKISGALACIFSGYDTANGFYYPASNNGRMAAGYVGLYRVGNDSQPPQSLGKNGLFASLVQPPDLPSYVSGQAPYALNLDASRLIFAGPVATGGGHDDIFKDDVIHMVWAVTEL